MNVLRRKMLIEKLLIQCDFQFHDDNREREEMIYVVYANTFQRPQSVRVAIGENPFHAKSL